MASIELPNAPDALKPTMRELMTRPEPADVIASVMDRSNEFSTPLAAMFAGAYMSEYARATINRRLDKRWGGDTGTKLDSATVYPEVVVGSGLHAAIYCAVRAANGKRPPLVIEQGDRVGGAFAVSEKPSFYLNSRNRPGGLSIPGEGGALNLIPAGPVQPSDLDASEYQTNTAMAWAIRMALVTSGARIVTRCGKLEEVKESKRNSVAAVKLQFENVTLLARRVILATGLGDELRLNSQGNRILTFSDMMRRMDEPFPLRGMKRVAVIGFGDGAKTAVEALVGQGPSTGYSTSSIDWVEKIDWYGVRADHFNRVDFQTCARARYKRIGGLFPESGNDISSRIRPSIDRVGGLNQNYDVVSVNGKFYDHAIVAVGYGNRGSTADGGIYRTDTGYAIARKFPGVENMFVVGSASDLPLTDYEQLTLPTSKEIKIAMFRTSRLTAELADKLP